MKTGAELVAFARSKIGCGYVFGSTGELITDAFLLAKAAQYPSQYSSAYLQSSRRWIGHIAFDCSGLVRYPTGSTTNANGFYTRCTSKAQIGSLADIPKVAGLLLFKINTKGVAYHVGIYDGNGRVVEARGVAYGVIERDIDSTWSYWGYCHIINYGGTASMLLKVGSTGAEVKTLQVNLNTIGGYGLVVDGNFGAKTEAAVKDFQSKHALVADGIVGDKTLAAIAQALTPTPVVLPAPNYAGQLNEAAISIAQKDAQIVQLKSEIEQYKSQISAMQSQYDGLNKVVGVQLGELKAVGIALDTLNAIASKY